MGTFQQKAKCEQMIFLNKKIGQQHIQNNNKKTQECGTLLGEHTEDNLHFSPIKTHKMTI